MKVAIKTLSILYLPIFFLGAFLIGLSVVLLTLGQLLMLETNKDKRGYELMKRSFFKKKIKCQKNHTISAMITAQEMTLN